MTHFLKYARIKVMNTELPNKTLFLVDFSWLYNKYYYGVVVNSLKEPEPSINDKELAERISIYLNNHLSNISKLLGDTEVILVLDPKTSDLVNSKIYSGYKAQRDTEIKHEVYKFQPQVIKALSKKYTALISDEYEADQVIAHLAIKYKSNYRGVIIYSGDKDLIQLTCYKSVKIADSYKNKELHILTDKEIFSKFKDYRYIPFDERISSNKVDILKYRVLRGDVSDNIPPVVPRLKDADIKVIITECWQENKFSEEYLNEVLDKLYYINGTLSDKLRNNKDNWIRNIKLMNLFSMGKKEINIKEVHG